MEAHSLEPMMRTHRCTGPRPAPFDRGVVPGSVRPQRQPFGAIRGLTSTSAWRASHATAAEDQWSAAAPQPMAAPPRQGGAFPNRSDGPPGPEDQQQHHHHQQQQRHGPPHHQQQRHRRRSVKELAKLVQTQPSAAQALITGEVQLCRSVEEVGELFIAFSSLLNHINVTAMVCKLSKVRAGACSCCWRCWQGCTLYAATQ
jgi:hypothetical protein